MSDKDKSITYETLFSILRSEKSKEELQKLDDGFYLEVVKFIQDKRKIIESKDVSHKMDHEYKQYQNVRKLVRELFDRREGKILMMATNKARTGTKLINTSLMLKEEREFYFKVVTLFETHRSLVLYKLIDGELPDEDTQTLNEYDKKVEPEINVDCKTKMIKFIHPVPKFVGEELEVYGPFEKEDVANLPSKIAKILINKGRAKETS